MFKIRNLSLGATALVLASCTTAGMGFSYGDGPTPEGQLFGDYLAGSYAGEIEDAPARARYYSSAFARQPQSIELGEKALSAAISVGNMTLARALAIELSQLDPAEPMSRLLLGASEMRKGKYDAAAQRLHEQPADPSLGIMMAFMEAWAQYGLGNAQEAIAVFDSVEVGGYFDILSTLQKARIYAETGQTDKARAAFERVESSGLARIQVKLDKAEFLSGLGDDAGALTLLRDFDNEMGGVESGPIRTALNTLQSGGTLTRKRSAAEHAAMGLVDPASAFFAQQRVYDIAETYLRIALTLDPNNQNARLWLGIVLERMDRSYEAESVYADVPSASDYYVSAALSHANLLFRDEQDARAISMLKDLVAKHPTFITREALGTAYLIREDYSQALPYYDALVSSLSEEELAADPTPLYHRGICLEQSDRWAEAERDFKRVLELQPDNADVLNYLGYTWVDRGENLSQAFTMIRKAVELEPDSGAIVDSLGWAHYKLGQYSEARIHLEDATEKSPDSATIIDHLGDVYWKLGRFVEAGYQWERALTFDPTDEERANILRKLDGGVEAAIPSQK